MADPERPSQLPTEPPKEEFELTPEIAEYENRRTDTILAIGILLLAFFLGAFEEDGAVLGLRLRTGQLISERFPFVPRTDSLAYTVDPAKPWVNPSWFLDWSIYRLYSLHQRYGGALLVLCKTLLVLGTAAVLLSIRYPGPTRWGVAAGTALALVGASRHLAVGPEPVCLLLWALFLLVWFHARHAGQFRRLWLLVPLGVVWANVDGSYVLLAVVLGSMGLGELCGRLLPASCEPSGGRPSLGQVRDIFVVAGACLLAGLATPYGVASLRSPFQWVTKVLPQVPPFERSAAGWHSVLGFYVGELRLQTDPAPAILVGERGTFLQEKLWSYLDLAVTGGLPGGHYAWFVLMIAALASFVLNGPRFQFPRALAVLWGMLLPLIFERWMGPACLLLAVVTALNGQEFFLGAWGARTRISRGWMIWSQGGRAVTIVALFLVIFAALTGRLQGVVGRFGLGVADGASVQDGARWLAEHRFDGNGFAFDERTASYSVWKDSQRKNFADARWQLFGPVLDEFSSVRRALQADRSREWKAILDRYGASHVLVDPHNDLLWRPLLVMLGSTELAPLYVGDDLVVLGRTDATTDQPLVDTHRLAVNELAFRTKHQPPPAMDRSVIEPGIADWIWRTRQVPPPGLISGKVYSSGIGPFKKPGANFLALRELRRAVAADPDSPESHLWLAVAYHKLYAAEVEQWMQERRKAQRASGSASGGQVAVPASKDFLPLRHYQMMTSLQNALAAGADDAILHDLMFRICRNNFFFDLAADHAKLAIEKLPQDRAGELVDHLPRLEQGLEGQRYQYDNWTTMRQQELQQASVPTDRPIERAEVAFTLGLAKLGLEQIESAPPYGPEISAASAMVGGAYLMLGFPDKASLHLQNADLRGQLMPGEIERLTGYILAARGDYEGARRQFEQGVARTQAAQVGRALGAFEIWARAGQLETVGHEGQFLLSDSARHADMLMALALLRIEMGQPHEAPRDVEKFLQVAPRAQAQTYWPLLAYYWGLVTDQPTPPKPLDEDLDAQIARHFHPPDLPPPIPLAPPPAAPDDAGPAPRRSDEGPPFDSNGPRPTPHAPRSLEDPSTKPGQDPAAGAPAGSPGGGRP